MRQYLTATIQAMSQAELNDIVDPLTMKYIKENDPHPEIRVYAVGHEGKADLHLPGIGTKTFTWIQAAVRAIADRLKLGTAVFDRHDPNTNSHEGREQIGQIVGRAVKHVGDRLNTLAAIHIFPQFKSRPLDVASIEADIEFDHDEYQAWPTNIKNVTGIALGNSGTDKPGFPGATLLGAVQAFAVQAFGNDLGGNKMNLSDVKKAVSELGLKPTQVFDVGVIMDDSAVSSRVKEDNTNLYNSTERIKQERDKAREQIAGLENEKAVADKKLQNVTMQSKSSSIFDAVLADPERKLDDRARIFIKRNLKNFSTAAENEETLKADVGKFVDTQVVEYGEQAKLFGVKLEEPNPNTAKFKLPADYLVSPQNPPAPRTIPDARVQYPNRDTRLQEEMNPDTNFLIPGSKAALEAQKT